MEEKQSLGDIITNYIKKNKLTREQFAELIGVTSRAVRWYIDSIHAPSRAVLEKICQVTNTNIDLVTIKEGL